MDLLQLSASVYFFSRLLCRPHSMELLHGFSSGFGKTIWQKGTAGRCHNTPQTAGRNL